MTPDQAVPQLRTDTDPRLIVGWRAEKGSLAARRVPLDRSVVEDLRAIATDTVQLLASSEARSYEPHAKLEQREEHFTVPITDLPTKPGEQADDDGDPSPATAALLHITSAPDELEPVSPDALEDRTYLFYGLVFDDVDSKPVVLLKKADPVRAARQGRVALLGRNVLHRADPPTLTLAHDIDIVATATHLLVLRKSAFDTILNDVRIAMQDVDTNVERTATALRTAVRLNEKAEASLAAFAHRRPSYAVRLRLLPDRLNGISVTPDEVRARLIAMGNQPGDLLDGDEFSFPQNRVPLFLDLLEGRHFDDEWTGQRMRADRMSQYKAELTPPDGDGSRPR
ncbi:hypothetical protein [Geodermatophilus sp. SYSU D00815]